MKSLPTVFLLLTCAGAAVAQSPAVLGKKNADFLRGLVRAGYFDLAKSVSKLAETAAISDAEKSAIKAATLELDIKEAKLEGDASKQKDAILSTVKATQALIANGPDDEATDRHRAELADQFPALAEAYAAAIAQEKDPAKVAALRKEGDEVFKAAVAEFKARKTVTEKKRVEGKAETDVPYVIAFFNYGRMQYLHSLLFAPDSFECKRAIEGALNTLDEFDLEFGELLVAFEAKITAALCHKQLGAIDNAIGCLDDAINLRNRVDKLPNGTYKVERDAADVISAAVLQKMFFLKEQGDMAKVVATAKDFFDTIPEPLLTSNGKGVLATQAEAQLQLGDTDAAKAGAEKLVELDPKGPWGQRGQYILSTLISGGGAGAKIEVAKIVKIAESLAGQGETDQALRICRDVVLRSRSAEDAKYAAQALMITGAIYASRKCYHEASVAFDTIYRRYPKTEEAPDALWRSLNCYSELRASDDLAYYKRGMEERSKLLQANYGNDIHIPQLQLLEAKQLMLTGKLLEAAALYDKVPAESAVSLEARFRSADCYMRHGRKLESGKQTKDAKQFIDRALEAFGKVMVDVGTALQATKDQKQKANLEDIDFQTRVALANSLLQSTPPKAAEADELLKPIKAESQKDPSVLYALRIRSLILQGKVDDATGMIAVALEKSADSRALAAASGTLAKALDGLALDLHKQKQVNRAAEIWRKAAGFYLRSAEGAKDEEKSVIAERLFSIGLLLNGIDTKIESFVELPPDQKIVDHDAWEQSLALYAHLGEGGSSSSGWLLRISNGRTLGFLKRYGEAETVYAQLFADNKLVTPQGKIDTHVLTSKPQLLTAYLEWGYASRLAAQDKDDKARRANASLIFDKLVVGLPQDSKQWWYAKYGQLLTQFERADYINADIGMRGLERTNPDFDGDRHKLKGRFIALKQEIATKVPKQPAPEKPR